MTVRVLLLLAVAGCCLLAQTTGTATLVGTVSDTTGAVLVGAKVTVVNTATSYVHTGITNAEGGFYIPQLPPGSYRVTISSPGFKTYVRTKLDLRTNEMPRLDVRMEIGAVNESIEVTAAVPLLETETTTTGSILEGDTVVKLPVLQKRLQRVLLYMPSTTGIGFNVNGQRERSLGLTLDGVSAKEPILGTIGAMNNSVEPVIDNLEEVKVYTTGMPAEFGHAAGGLLNAVYRSGTNQLHGSLEDRFQNNTTVHRMYFDKLKPNVFNYHEITASASGPVYIPKLYDGHDRTFWLFGFQKHHENASETYIRDVPTPEMLAGDFSFGGKGLPIYDPGTTRQDGSGKWIRDPFPANRIPITRFDPVAKNFLANDPWTEPNQPGFFDSNGPHENLAAVTQYKSYRTRYDAKVDHQFKSNHRVFARYTHMRHRAYNDRWRVELQWRLIDDKAVPIPIDQRNAVISDTYTFGTTVINEARLGFNRRRYTRDPESAGQGWADKLGIPNVSGDTFPAFTNLFVDGFYSVSPGGRSQSVGEDFTFADNVTKAAGKHTYKMGYEVVRSRFNNRDADMPSGVYNFGRGPTSMPYTPNTGNGLASFLLGAVNDATFTQARATWLPRWWSQSLYFQDDIKPLRNVTLNLGLRWTYETPYQTKYGQQSQFNPDVVDVTSGRIGAITHPTGPLARRDLNNLQPRVGVAWNFHPKVVFRGSFGVMTQDILSTSTNLNFEEYFATAYVQSAPGDPRMAFQLSQGPPTFRYPVAADGTVPFVGSNYSGRAASWYDPNLRNPYIMHWSAGLQWEFARTWLVETLYQASAGVGLLGRWNINAIPLDISHDRAVLDKIYQATQNYKPWTQFGSVNLLSNFGHNTYHAGTLRSEKRYSSFLGSTLNAFYTYAKAIDETSGDGGGGGVTYYNRRLEKARASYDITHRFVGVTTMELPFGKRRSWLNQGGWSDYLIGGWDMSWTVTIQSGPPFGVGSPAALIVTYLDRREPTSSLRMLPMR